MRISGITYGTGPVDPHPVFHHWHPPSLRFRAASPTNEYGGFWVQLNSAGMVTARELASEPEAGVVLLGDSFVEGMNVPEHERIPTVIEREIQLTVFNLGASAFSPLLSRLQFETFRHRIRPNVVVDVLYANDISDDWTYRASAKEAGGEIVAVPGPSGVRFAVVRLTRRSYLARFVHRIWQVQLAAREFDGRRRVPGSGQWPPHFERPLTSLSRDQLAFTEGNIVSLAEAARRAGARFYLTAVPDRGAALHGLPDFFNEHMMRLAERAGMPYIDLVPAFRDAGVRSLFHEVDIHWNSAGHALAGRIIADRIRADAARAEMP